jgi:hypothetical protein
VAINPKVKERFLKHLESKGALPKSEDSFEQELARQLEAPDPDDDEPEDMPLPLAAAPSKASFASALRRAL